MYRLNMVETQLEESLWEHYMDYASTCTDYHYDYSLSHYLQDHVTGVHECKFTCNMENIVEYIDFVHERDAMLFVLKFS